MCAFFTDIEVWRPYPSPPDFNIIGDAILVPGHLVMRRGINTLREVLLERETQINSARTVVLVRGNVGTITYLAPRAEPIDRETFIDLAHGDGVDIAVVVLDGENHLGIPPGPYLQRVFTDGDDNWYLEYIGPNFGPVTRVEMEEDEYFEEAFLDEYPTSAIFFGSHKCRTGWWGLDWLRRGRC